MNLSTFDSNSKAEINVVDLTMTEEIVLIRGLENRINSCRSSEEWIDVIELSFDLGDVYMNMQNYEMAKKLYSESMELSQHFGDRKRYGIACYKLAKMFAASSDIIESLSYFFDFLKESKEVDDSKNICKAYYHLCELYSIIGNKKLFLKYCQHYSTLSRNLNPSESVIKALDEMDTLILELGNFPSIPNKSDGYDQLKTNHDGASLMDMNRKCLIFDQSINPIYSWHECNYKGIQLYHMQKYHIAIKLFFRGFPDSNNSDKVASNTEFNYCKAESLGKIGACLREMKQYKEAASYFKQILDIKDDLFTGMYKFAAYCELEICYQRMSEDAEEYTHKKNGMMMRRGWSLIPDNNLAEIYYFSGHYSEALYYYQGIVKETEYCYHKLQNFHAYCNLGHAYLATGCLVEAFKAYQKAKTIGNNLTAGLALASVLYNIYQIYRLRKDLTSAKTELDAYLNLSSQMGDNIGSCLGYETMSDLLEEMKDYKGAFEFAKKHLECSKIIGDNDDILCAEKNVEQLNQYARKNPGNRISITREEMQKISELHLRVWDNRNKMALEYYNSGRYDLAEKTCLANLEFVREKHMNKYFEVVTLKKLGLLSIDSKNTDSAYRYFSAAFHGSQYINNIQLSRSIRYLLGLTLLTKNRKVSDLNAETDIKNAKSDLLKAASIFQNYLHHETETKYIHSAMDNLREISSLIDELYSIYST